MHYKSYHDSAYNYASDIEGFIPLGFFTEDLSDSSTRLTISGSNLSDLEAATVSEIKQGENIAIIENSDKTKLEWIAFEGVSYDSNADTYTLNNVWRGTLGTVPQGHLTGARVCLLITDCLNRH